MHERIAELCKEGDALASAGRTDDAKQKYIAALKLLPGEPHQWEAATWNFSRRESHCDAADLLLQKLSCRAAMTVTNRAMVKFYGLAQLEAPYSQLHGMPVSSRTIFTIPGNNASARTSFDKMTTQRLRCSRHTHVLPVESLWPPF